ncbi:MAG: acyltransferase [Acidimicrobiales bacterium]|nr:acyltransferase [Acidimicrobiales bacterium]
MQAEGAPAPARHRPGLDGARGVAVAAVVAYHLELVPGGFVGVDVFFVLSGFLITGLVLDEVAATRAVSLRAFWGRRVRRLVPAVLVVVPTVVLVALGWGWPDDQRRDLGLDAIATLTWWANWRQAHGASYWDSGENPFRHAWSLSIEEQFYLLWPLAVVGIVALVVARRRRRPGSLAVPLGAVAAALAAASATWMVVLSHRLDDGDLSRVYVGTDTRAFAPLAGCALACWVRARRSAPARRGVVLVGGLIGAGALGWAVAALEVDDPATYRHGLLVAVTLAAILVVRAAGLAEGRDRDPLALVTTSGVARHLGRRSYAIYLWSWPVQVLVAFRWPGIERPVLVVATVVIALVLAEVSHHLVEAPLRHRSGWAAAPARRRPAWAAGGLVAVAAIAASLSTAEPPPKHETVEAEEAAREALRPPPSTEAGTADGGLRVMLAGDSVAWTYGYYRPHGDELPEGIASVDSRAIIGCGLLAGEGWGYPLHGDGPFVRPAAGACADQPEAERLGLEGQPDVVLLFPGAWEWSDAESPDGRVVAARSPEMRDLVVERLLRKARAADAAGARTVIAQWACPGPESAPPLRDPAYLAWIDDVIAETAAEGRAAGLDVEVLEASPAVCTDGEAQGTPTPERAAATGGEIHVVSFEGGRWLWDAWLAPGLLAT